MTTEQEDRSLVAAFLRSRSEHAFLALYHRHTPGLYRFAARLAGRPGVEADELVQEAWVRAIEGLGDFRWESALKTWLCSVLLNCWREVRRGQERDRKILSLARVDPPSRTRADTARLEAAIEALPTGYREVLVLHDVEGYPHMDIARHFGIAEGTSKSQLHRARRALRELLDSGGEARHGE